MTRISEQNRFSNNYQFKYSVQYKLCIKAFDKKYTKFLKHMGENRTIEAEVIIETMLKLLSLHKQYFVITQLFPKIYSSVQCIVFSD
jgi:hypothetical protein